MEYIISGNICRNKIIEKHTRKKQYHYHYIKNAWNEYNPFSFTMNISKVPYKIIKRSVDSSFLGSDQQNSQVQ